MTSPMISRAGIEAAAEAMKQRRRSEIEHGVCRATFEEMATLALSAALAAEGMALGGQAVIEGEAVVIRFPVSAMQDALDGAWSMRVFDQRQKITNEAEFAKEFCNELNQESENGTTLVHRMADKAFVNMIESGAFGFDLHEDQDEAAMIKAAGASDAGK